MNDKQLVHKYGVKISNSGKSIQPSTESKCIPRVSKSAICRRSLESIYVRSIERLKKHFVNVLSYQNYSWCL